jgi:DNA polymerase III alpha subunit
MRAEGTPWAQGWGAASSSLLLYALGATVIDPIRHGLLFERFVGPVAGTEPYVPFIVTSGAAVPQELTATLENATDGNLDEDAFEELVATLSLQRPSPEAAGVTAEYARRRAGSHRAALPALDAVTTRTRGLVLYDEQIIQAIAQATGWSLLEAEAARRELVRPGPGVARLRDRFSSDAIARGKGKEGIGPLFDILTASARTAVQKSHHVALAMVACKAARPGRNDPNGSMSVG